MIILARCRDAADPSKRCVDPTTCRCKGYFEEIVTTDQWTPALIHLRGSRILSKRTRPVREDEDVSALVERLRVTMLLAGGIGLAAPQIGDPRRVAVIRSDKTKDGYVALVNPVFEPTTTQTGAMWEGCLSVPGIQVMIHRPWAGIVKARGTHWPVNGLEATSAQHELDHLDGVLITDRIEPVRGQFRPNFRFSAARPHTRADGVQYVVCPGCGSSYLWEYRRRIPVMCYRCGEQFNVGSRWGF